MFQRLSTSWGLARASYEVLRSDKELIVFPIVSSILSLIVTATFFIPAILYMIATHPHGGADQMHVSPLYYIGLFAYYLVLYFVIFFANTALVGAAMIRLRGGAPTVADGFRLAASRTGAIFGYALISATVGVVLRTLQERTGLIGRFVLGFIGLAWNVATYLVTPVLAAENLGPIAAVKRSAELLKQTWGEQIVGTAGISAAFSLIGLAVLLLFFGLITAGIVLQSVALIITSVVLLLLAVVALALIQSALTGIYTAAVYLYAAEGITVGQFDGEMIRSAFRRK